MSLLSYSKMRKMVEQELTNAPMDYVTRSGIKVTLNNVFLRETPVTHAKGIADISDSLCVINYNKVTKHTEAPYVLTHGEYVSVATVETFLLFDDMMAQFIPLEHFTVNGACFNSSVLFDADSCHGGLTLGIKNMTRYHSLLLTPGMAIGHVVFHSI